MLKAKWSLAHCARHDDEFEMYSDLALPYLHTVINRLFHLLFLFSITFFSHHHLHHHHLNHRQSQVMLEKRLINSNNESCIEILFDYTGEKNVSLGLSSNIFVFPPRSNHKINEERSCVYDFKIYIPAKSRITIISFKFIDPIMYLPPLQRPCVLFLLYTFLWIFDIFCRLRNCLR